MACQARGALRTITDSEKFVDDTRLAAVNPLDDKWIAGKGEFEFPAKCCWLGVVPVPASVWGAKPLPKGLTNVLGLAIIRSALRRGYR
jgi:hypothetical protein